MTATPDRRALAWMRQTVALVQTQHRRASLKTRHAAEWLYCYGVPLHVALRVLVGRVRHG